MGKKEGTIKALHIAGHILGIMLFLCFTVLIYPIPPGVSLRLSHAPPPLVRDIVGNLLLILFFYLNYYVLIHRILFAKRYFVYAVLVTVAAIVVVGMPNWLTGAGMGIFNAPKGGMPFGNGGMEGPPLPHHNDFLSALRINGHIILLFIIVTVFSVLLKLQRHNTELKQLQLEAERKFLSSQIGPHFLFNTLNSIYSLSLVDSGQTPDALLKLSQFMRYAYSKNQQPLVPLSSEVEYVNNYLDLQRIRFGDTVAIEAQTQLDEASGKAMVPPLLLMTFIENAFKHGVYNGKENDIHIYLRAQEGNLEMQVVNRLHQIANSTTGWGIGIANIRSQLQLEYPQRHNLHIATSHDRYTVHLKIHLL